MPTHSHDIFTRATAQTGGSENPPLDAVGAAQNYSTSEVGGSQPHTHSLSGVSSEAAGSLPPYYAGHYVIRV